MRRLLKWVDAGPPEPDPYLYGGRHVRVEHPDGTETLDMVPLTLEDVLFPKVGDFIPNGVEHFDDLAYLRGVFECPLREDPSAKVLTRCGVDWNLPGIRPVCPDTVVFTGVKRRINWSIFDVAAEGAQPQLVIEVTVPWTRQLDLGPKLEIYHRAKVPFYLIADNPRWEERRPLELIGYRYARRAYRRVAPDKHGRIRLEAVRLGVGLQRHPRGGYQRLRCFDLETGREYGDYSEESEWLAAAEAKVDRAPGVTGRPPAPASPSTRARGGRSICLAHRIIPVLIGLSNLTGRGAPAEGALGLDASPCGSPGFSRPG